MAQNYILILHTDTGSTCEIKYVINIVHALEEIGFKVNLLTTNNSLKYSHDVSHELVYPWVPRSIFGHYQRFCMIARSLILSIYTCWITRKQKPSLVICDGSPYIIPLLKYFNYKVSFVNFMISFQQLVTKIKIIKKTSLEHSCLLRADDIIILSEECAELLEDIDEKRKVVLPPIIDYIQYPNASKITQNEKVFVILSDFSDTDQIITVLEAYVQLRDMLGLLAWKKTCLIILGCCGHDPTMLQESILNQEIEIRTRIKVCEATDISIVRKCITECYAVFNLIKNTIWNAPLLACMLDACPIVCLQEQNNKRLIQKDVTGLEIKNHVHTIRNCMHWLIKNDRRTKQLGERAALQVRNEFSRCMFRERLESIVSKYNIVKYCIPLHKFSLKNTVDNSEPHYCKTRSNYDYKICEN